MNPESTPDHAQQPDGPPADAPQRRRRSVRSPANAKARPIEPGAATAAFAILSSLLVRDDGWLRIVPHTLDAALYVKWKFTRGRWNGYYVMARTELWQLDYALDLLRDKLEAVDEGSRRPTLDHAFID